MGFFSNVWGNLVMNARKGGLNALGGTNFSYRYRNDDGVLVYRKHRTYKYKAVQEASRIAIQTAMNEINQLYPNYLKKTQKEKRLITFQSQLKNLQKLIENQMVLVNQEYGKVYDEETKHNLFAVDKYGNLVPEALMLYYRGEDKISSEQYYSEVTNISSKKGTRKTKNANAVSDDDAHAVKLDTPNFLTTLVCHIDLAPDIQISSKKNLILSPVQGRDYSRKELVSGGDLTFSVNGSIVSDQPDVYPTAAVQKFVMNMQYGGILTVHNFQFEQLGVTRLLIQDWQLGNLEYKNIQPYSFTCVAVEPDDEIIIQDTIQRIDSDLEYADGLKSWQKLLMNDKFQQINQNASTNLINSSISSLTDLTSGKI